METCKYKISRIIISGKCNNTLTGFNSFNYYISTDVNLQKHSQSNYK